MLPPVAFGDAARAFRLPPLHAVGQNQCIRARMVFSMLFVAARM